MAYKLECECGRTREVSVAQAGTDLVCDGCGAVVRVPSLSRLREREGRGAYESGVIDTIARMVAAGELTGEGPCAVSGRTTSDVLTIHVQAERPVPGREASDSWVALTLIMPLAGLLALLRRDGYAQRADHGRDTALEVPLRVRREYHDRLRRRAGRRRLRALLRTVPVYARLLDEYPTARLSVRPEPATRGPTPRDPPLDDAV